MQQELNPSVKTDSQTHIIARSITSRSLKREMLSLYFLIAGNPDCLYFYECFSNSMIFQLNPGSIFLYPVPALCTKRENMNLNSVTKAGHQSMNCSHRILKVKILCNGNQIKIIFIMPSALEKQVRPRNIHC